MLYIIDSLLQIQELQCIPEAFKTVRANLGKGYRQWNVAVSIWMAVQNDLSGICGW